MGAQALQKSRGVKSTGVAWSGVEFESLRFGGLGFGGVAGGGCEEPGGAAVLACTVQTARAAYTEIL